jgi:hypothetical protein
MHIKPSVRWNRCKNRGVRQLGDCLKTHIWIGLSALIHLDIVSWGVAPGWYEAAPSAL